MSDGFPSSTSRQVAATPMSYSRYGCACAQCAAADNADAAHEGSLASTWTAANVSSTTVVAYSYTGDYRADTIMGGLDARWNVGSALGTPVTVTYSFMGAKPVYGGTDSGGDTGFLAFNTTQRAAVRQVFTKLQAELNIAFVEVADSAYSYGQIRFGNNYQDASSGYAWLPGSGSDLSGDVWLDAYTSANLSPREGNAGWETLVHEIGHALGLKHPGNYNAGTVAQSQPGNYLATAEDNANYTVMSYYEATGGQSRDWFGMYDLLALKKMYGADPSYRAGHDTYRYTDASGTVLSIIDDAGGSDTIDLSGLTTGAVFDLRPGTFSSVGRNGWNAASNNVSIDLLTTVENLVGTAYGDTVRGNDVANRFTLGGGTNAAEGGGGIDTAVYTGVKGAYSASASGGVLRVAGSGLSDSLTGIERLEFADRKLAFDLDGNAGLVAKTLGAVFGSASVGNAGYAGTGLKLADSGMLATDLMQYALNTHLGPAPGHEAIVRLLYTNVVGHAPTAAEEGHYVNQLNSGAFTQATLGLMAAQTDLNTANIGLVGLAGNGLAFA